MNVSLAILCAPMGCFSHSASHCSFQHATQSYVREVKQHSMFEHRKTLIRTVLTNPRLNAEVDAVIRGYLCRFTPADQWSAMTKERRTATVRELYDRIRAVAAGRTNGTAVFDKLVSSQGQ